jgi:CRP-like cAMP-binding protein
MDLVGLDRLIPALGIRIARRDLPEGAHLFRQGDPARAVFVVERGRVALVRHAPDGAPVVLHVARGGDSVAEASLFSDTYHCDAIAEIASRVAVVPKGPLKAALARDPALAQAMMARLARQVQALRARLELRNIKSARERTWQMLLIAAGGEANTVTFDRPLKDLAAEIGLTHEAFYRALAELAREGRIERERRRVRIVGNSPES